MTEIETLRKERDELYQQYLQKVEELHAYIKNQESGAIEELKEAYKGKIIQVRQWDYSLNPSGNRREREDDKQIIFVEEVTNYNWLENEIEITGTVLELFGDTTYQDFDHLSDSDLDKLSVKIYHTKHMRVKRDDIWHISEDDVSGMIGEFDYKFEQIQHKFWKAVRGKKSEADGEPGSN